MHTICVAGVLTLALVAAIAPAAAQLPNAASPFAPLRNPPPGVDPALGAAPGRSITVSIQDLPPEARAMFLTEMENDRHGFSPVSEDVIADAFNAAATARSPSDPDMPNLQGAVRAEQTGLSQFRFIGTVPELRTEGRLVMAKRVFQRPDGVFVTLEEWQFGGTSGGPVVIRELMNARVGPHPARLTIERAPSGAALSTLVWDDGRTAYVLEVLDDVDRPRAGAAGSGGGREWLMSLAESLGT